MSIDEILDSWIDRKKVLDRTVTVIELKYNPCTCSNYDAWKTATPDDDYDEVEIEVNFSKEDLTDYMECYIEDYYEDCDETELTDKVLEQIYEYFAERYSEHCEVD